MLFKFAIAFSLILSLCSSPQQPETSSIFVASTPGDSEIKSILTIPADAKVDFIRWNLDLQHSGVFDLKIMYGVSKPNTLGFYDTTVKTYKGTYSIGKGAHPVYHLKADGMNELMLAKINENIFHILTKHGKLMVGNGGWSYTLNAATPGPLRTTATSFSEPIIDTARQLVFDGRTPCKEFAVDHGVEVNPACFKVKWRLILNRDPVTLEPTTYSTRRIVYDLANNTGKWVIRKTDSQGTIIQLNPDQPDRSISLLMVDGNILYFLDSKGQPYTGNADFSFALNRIQ